MFTVVERDQVRERLLHLAKADPGVAAAAITGSYAAGADEWSDAGLAWHHILHARACIDRAKPWQAEYLISGGRHHVLALACVRLGFPTKYAKGADLLPRELTVLAELGSF